MTEHSADQCRRAVSGGDEHRVAVGELWFTAARSPSSNVASRPAARRPGRRACRRPRTTARSAEVGAAHHWRECRQLLEELLTVAAERIDVHATLGEVAGFEGRTFKFFLMMELFLLLLGILEVVQGLVERGSVAAPRVCAVAPVVPVVPDTEGLAPGSRSQTCFRPSQSPPRWEMRTLLARIALAALVAVVAVVAVVVAAVAAAAAR